MTDIEKFIELYRSFGIDCKVVKTDYERCVRQEITLGDAYTEDCTTSEKISCYNGFYTVVSFDESGKFIEQGIWE